MYDDKNDRVSFYVKPLRSDGLFILLLTKLISVNLLPNRLNGFSSGISWLCLICICFLIHLLLFKIYDVPFSKCYGFSSLAFIDKPEHI